MAWLVYNERVHPRVFVRSSGSLLETFIKCDLPQTHVITLQTTLSTEIDCGLRDGDNIIIFK